MTYRPVEYHPAFEEYCETIFELGEGRGAVIQARVAERLRVSRPAVSEMVRRLTAEGLAEATDGAIRLTDDGLELAARVVRRHRLAERFLVDVLGLGWGEAHHEAGRWEHVMSDDVEAAMARVLGDPTTCPHGNPIPGSAYRPPALVTTVAGTPVGGHVEVVRIAEDLEFEEALLDFLQAHEVAPGAIAQVVSVAPDGTVTLAVGGRSVGLSAHACERIHVRPADAGPGAAG